MYRKPHQKKKERKMNKERKKIIKNKLITKNQKKDIKGQKNKKQGTLTPKNAIRLKTVITMTTNHRNQNR
jgi:hypothetical protein